MSTAVQASLCNKCAVWYDLVYAIRSSQALNACNTPSMQQTTPIQMASPASKPGNLHPESPPARPTRLLLVRHAENMQGRQLHFAPNEAGLTARGWEQAIALAQWLHTYEEIDAVLTDTLLPARLTAQRLGQQLGLRMQISQNLPKGADAIWALEPPSPAPDGQSAETLTRYTAYGSDLARGFSLLLNEIWGKTVLLVTDAVTIAAMVRAIGAGAELGIALAYTSLSEVVYSEGHWSLAYANRTEHLPRRAPPRRADPADTHQHKVSDQATNAEIEKIVQFYNQVALRIGHENSAESENRLQQLQDISSEELLRFAELDEESHLILAGAGSGRLAIELAQAGVGEVVGVDVSPAMLEKAEFLRLNTENVPLHRVNFRLAPAHDLPFPEGRFNAALCVHLLHHLANPRPTLHELHRLLPAQGKLILIDIDGAGDAVKRATQNAIENRRNPTHATIRTSQQMVALLEECGFQVEKDQHWTVGRSVGAWLNAIAVDEATRTAVVEMLEASIETDAAGLHVRRHGADLHFDAPIVAFLARKTA